MIRGICWRVDTSNQRIYFIGTAILYATRDYNVNAGGLEPQNRVILVTLSSSSSSRMVASVCASLGLADLTG